MSLIKIPYTSLESETLRNLIEEFVSREGTDNGLDIDLDTKVAQVTEQLSKNAACIVYDEESESTNIVVDLVQ